MMEGFPGIQGLGPRPVRNTKQKLIRTVGRAETHESSHRCKTVYKKVSPGWNCTNHTGNEQHQRLVGAAGAAQEPMLRFHLYKSHSVPYQCYSGYSGSPRYHTPLRGSPSDAEFTPVKCWLETWAPVTTCGIPGLRVFMVATQCF